MSEAPTITVAVDSPFDNEEKVYVEVPGTQFYAYGYVNDILREATTRLVLIIKSIHGVKKDDKVTLHGAQLKKASGVVTELDKESSPGTLTIELAPAQTAEVTTQ